jgi:hypothetical protein
MTHDPDKPFIGTLFITVATCMDLVGDVSILRSVQFFPTKNSYSLGQLGSNILAK